MAGPGLAAARARRKGEGGGASLARGARQACFRGWQRQSATALLLGGDFFCLQLPRRSRRRRSERSLSFSPSCPAAASPRSPSAALRATSGGAARGSSLRAERAAPLLLGGWRRASAAAQRRGGRSAPASSALALSALACRDLAPSAASPRGLALAGCLSAFREAISLLGRCRRCERSPSLSPSWQKPRDFGSTRLWQLLALWRKRRPGAAGSEFAEAGLLGQRLLLPLPAPCAQSWSQPLHPCCLPRCCRNSRSARAKRCC